VRVYTLKCELMAPVSMQEAFAVFQDPYNLARLTPPWLGFRIVTQGVEMRQGAEMEYRLRWMGVPLHWKTVITEYEPPFYFVDEAVKSPYVLWRHRHTFRPTLEGTAVVDEVNYALPFGWIGRAAHTLAVGKQLERIFAFRQQAIAELIGGTVRQVRQPVITAEK